MFWMRNAIWSVAAVAALCAAGAGAEEGPVVLENARLRIELDPVLFSVSFIGFPGGVNFVEPQHVDEGARQGKGWLDPGGLTTDLVPLEGQDAALRRGPGEVIERDAAHVVVLGAESEALGVRLKKELRLDGDAARAWYIVTALSTRAEGPSVCVRTGARLAAGATARIPKQGGTFAPMHAEPKAPWAVVNSREYWLVPVPPTARVAGLVLGGVVAGVEVENRSGIWKRRFTQPPTDPARLWNGVTVLCVLDDKTRSYGLSLQGAQAPLTAATPLQLTEEWTFEER